MSTINPNTTHVRIPVDTAGKPTLDVNQIDRWILVDVNDQNNRDLINFYSNNQGAINDLPDPILDLILSDDQFEAHFPIALDASQFDMASFMKILLEAARKLREASMNAREVSATLQVQARLHAADEMQNAAAQRAIQARISGFSSIAGGIVSVASAGVSAWQTGKGANAALNASKLREEMASSKTTFSMSQEQLRQFKAELDTPFTAADKAHLEPPPNQNKQIISAKKTQLLNATKSMENAKNDAQFAMEKGQRNFAASELKKELSPIEGKIVDKNIALDDAEIDLKRLQNENGEKRWNVKQADYEKAATGVETARLDLKKVVDQKQMLEIRQKIFIAQSAVDLYDNPEEVKRELETKQASIGYLTTEEGNRLAHATQLTNWTQPNPKPALTQAQQQQFLVFKQARDNGKGELQTKDQMIAGTQQTVSANKKALKINQQAADVKVDSLTSQRMLFEARGQLLNALGQSMNSVITGSGQGSTAGAIDAEGAAQARQQRYEAESTTYQTQQDRENESVNNWKQLLDSVLQAIQESNRQRSETSSKINNMN